jgi:hypothetical protein
VVVDSAIVSRFSGVPCSFLKGTAMNLRAIQKEAKRLDRSMRGCVNAVRKDHGWSGDEAARYVAENAEAVADGIGASPGFVRMWCAEERAQIARLKKATGR